VTQVEEGTDWVGAGLEFRAPEYLEVGTAVAVAFRDARGAATNLSPHNPDGSIRWWPFSADNKIRGDLFKILRDSDTGTVITNTEDNQGFVHLGPQKDGDGPSFNPKVTTSHVMIVQDIYPYYSEITELSHPFSVTPIDFNAPWVQRLYDREPLVDDDGNWLLEDPGQAGAIFGSRPGGHNPARQFLFFRERKVDGLSLYSCDIVTYCKQDDLGKSKMDKKDPRTSEITFLPTPDNITMGKKNGIYQPIGPTFRVYGGPGYVALGGLPVFAGSAPVATATTALHASLAFDGATGAGDPFTYKVQQSTDGGTTWGSLITPTSQSLSGDTITLQFAAAAGASKFRAVATGTNGATANTAASNSATIAAS